MGHRSCLALWRVGRSSKQDSSSKRVPGSLLQWGLRCLEERVLKAAWRAGVGGAGDEVGEGQGLHGAEGAQGNLGKSGSSRGAAGLLAAMGLQWLGQCWGWCCTGKGGGEVAWDRISVPAARALSSQAGLDLHATLRSRIATVRYGQIFELVCQVNASYTLEKVPVSAVWLFQSSPPTGCYHELVRIFPSGTVSWGAAQPHFQGKAQLTKAATSFSLRIHNAAAADEGTYQCEVEVWRRNSLPLGQPSAIVKSNAVGIKVVLPGKQCQ